MTRLFLLLPLLPACATSVAEEDAASLAELQATVADLQSTVEDLQTQVESLQSQATTCQASSVRVVEENTEVPISDAEGLRTALADLDHILVADGSTYTLELPAGTLEFTEPLHFSHPTGSRIQFVGQGVDVTILSFTGSDGIVVDGASALGGVGGFTLDGNGDGAAGILVSGSSSVTIASPMKISSFHGYCVAVNTNSSLLSLVGTDLAIEGCSTGVVASESSTIIIGEVQVEADFRGMEADYGSYLGAPDAVVKGGTDRGYMSYGGSFMYLGGASYTGTGVGFNSFYHAGIDAFESNSNTESYDYLSSTNGYIYVGDPLGGRGVKVATQDLTDLICLSDDPGCISNE